MMSGKGKSRGGHVGRPQTSFGLVQFLHSRQLLRMSTVLYNSPEPGKSSDIYTSKLACTLRMLIRYKRQYLSIICPGEFEVVVQSQATPVVATANCKAWDTIGKCGQCKAVA